MYQYDIIGADLRVCPNNTQQLGEHQLDNMVGHQLGDGNVNVLGEWFDVLGEHAGSPLPYNVDTLGDTLKWITIASRGAMIQNNDHNITSLHT